MKGEDFALNHKIYELFVKGAMRGYSEYLDVRIDRSSMKVSHAYAWVKGNHIDDAIATEGEIPWRLSMAGPTWGYLQFQLEKNNENCLAIVKQADRIQETIDDLQKKTEEDREKNWIYPLSQINKDKNLENLLEKQSNESLRLYSDSNEEQIIEQLSLNMENEFDRFYIFTYELNTDSLGIVDMSLMMIEPKSLELIEIEKLTDVVRDNLDIIPAETLEATSFLKKEQISSPTFTYPVHSPLEVSGEKEDYPANEQSAENNAKKERS